MALFFSGFDRDPETQNDIYSFHPNYPLYSKRKKREIAGKVEGHFVNTFKRNKRSVLNTDGYQDYGTCAYKTMWNELCMNGLISRAVCQHFAQGM